MKFNQEIDINIKDYIGRFGPGVTIILSILYDNKLYEGMYWYTEEESIIQFPQEIEIKMDLKIESHSEYENIMNFLKSQRVNYSEIAPKLSEIFD